MVCEKRLKQVLVLDKQINNSIINIIKSDVLYALKNYMEITANDINLDLDIDEFGFYNLNISAKVRRLISFSSLQDDL